MRFAQCALKKRFVNNKIYHTWKAGDAMQKCKHTICVFEILPAAKGDAFSLHDDPAQCINQPKTASHSPQPLLFT
jgi:hypothetical protein